MYGVVIIKMHALNRLLINACQPKFNAKILSLLDAVHRISMDNDMELNDMLHRVAHEQGWPNIEQRVQDLVARLSSITIYDMVTLHDAYTRQPQRRNATARAWQCSTGQMQPIRKFEFGGVAVVIRQETDERAIYEHREGQALEGDFAGVGMVVWKAPLPLTSL